MPDIIGMIDIATIIGMIIIVIEPEGIAITEKGMGDTVIR